MISLDFIQWTRVIRQIGTIRLGKRHCLCQDMLSPIIPQLLGWLSKMCDGKRTPVYLYSHVSLPFSSKSHTTYLQVGLPHMSFAETGQTSRYALKSGLLPTLKALQSIGTSSRGSRVILPASLLLSIFLRVGARLPDNQGSSQSVEHAPQRRTPCASLVEAIWKPGIISFSLDQQRRSFWDKFSMLYYYRTGHVAHRWVEK